MQKEFDNLIIWIISTPIILALIVTILSYFTLPRCKIEKKRDRRWSIETSSIIFVSIYMISTLYLTYYRPINLPNISITNDIVEPSIKSEPVQKIVGGLSNIATNLSEAPEPINNITQGGKNMLQTFQTGLPQF